MATTANVILFKPSGKYYTQETWAIPDGAIGPHDMVRSPDAHRIDGGPVLVPAQEPWGYPHMFPGAEYEREQFREMLWRPTSWWTNAR